MGGNWNQSKGFFFKMLFKMFESNSVNIEGGGGGT